MKANAAGANETLNSQESRKVESLDEITSGYYKFAYEENYASIKSSNGLYLTSSDKDAALIFYIDKMSDGSYTIFNDEIGYIGSKAAKSLIFSPTIQNNSGYYWNISTGDSNEGNFKITNKDYSELKLQYNETSPRFLTYDNDNQKDLDLWTVSDVTPSQPSDVDIDNGDFLTDGLYSIGLYQQYYKEYYYLNGNMDGYYAAGSTDFSSSAFVTVKILDKAKSTFSMQLSDGKYIAAVKNNTYNNLILNSDEIFPWTYDSETHMIYGLCGDTEVYLGSTGNYENFTINLKEYANSSGVNLAHLYFNEPNTDETTSLVTLNYGLYLENSITFAVEKNKTFSIPTQVEIDIPTYKYHLETLSGELFDDNSLINENLELNCVYERLGLDEYFKTNETKTSLVASVSRNGEVKHDSSIIDFSRDVEKVSINNDKNYANAFDLDETIWDVRGKTGKENVNNNSTTVPTINNSTSSNDFRIYAGGSVTFKIKDGFKINKLFFSDNNVKKLSIAVNGESSFTKITDLEMSFDEDITTIEIMYDIDSSKGNVSLTGTLQIEYTYDDSIIEPTYAALRFGTTIDSYYVNTYNNAKFGIAIARETDLKNSNLDSLTDYITSVGVNFESDSSDKFPLIVSYSGAYVENENDIEESANGESAPLYQFAATVYNLHNHIDERLSAVAFAINDDEVYLMKETTTSVREICSDYIALGYDSDANYKLVLNAFLNK